MKMKYEKPNLEELELIIEGSYLTSKSARPNPTDPDNPDIPIEGGEGDDF